MSVVRRRTELTSNTPGSDDPLLQSREAARRNAWRRPAAAVRLRHRGDPSSGLVERVAGVSASGRASGSARFVVGLTNWPRRFWATGGCLARDGWPMPIVSCVAREYSGRCRGDVGLRCNGDRPSAAACISPSPGYSMTVRASRAVLGRCSSLATGVSLVGCCGL